MYTVKEGSKWGGSDGRVFHVISIVEIEGNTWVHYILERKDEPIEYSCYLESFVGRFTPLPD